MLIFELLQVALGRRERLSMTPSASEWQHLHQLSEQQSLQGVCYAAVKRLPKDQWPDEQNLIDWIWESQRIAERNKLLSERSAQIYEHLTQEGFDACLLKGQGNALLYGELSSLGAKSVVVFLDACFSGSKRGEGMIASARGVVISARNSTPRGNMVVFSAAQENETAYPYKEQGHGMFTYYLLKKLKDSKGETTLGDLADYITQSVKERSIVKNSKSQTPAVSASHALAGSWRDMKLK